MAVHYILDGYNIIKRMPLLAEKNLRAGRDALIHILESEKPHGSSRNKVTVVFDGQPGLVNDRAPCGIEIVFTSGTLADDKIKQIVNGAENKKNMIVVTDDNEIRYHVRALGARILGGCEFLGPRQGPGQKLPEVRAESSAAFSVKRITKALERQINQELEQVWLKKGKS